MARRLVRGRSRVLLSDSSDEDSSDNIDVVVKHVVAEGNAAAPALVAPPGIDSMVLEDEIEDDDISVEEDEPPVTIFPLAEPFTPAVSRVPRQENMNRNSDDGLGNPLHQLLQKRGIRVHSEWLASFVREMETAQPGFSTFGVEKQGEFAFSHLLVADFNEVGAGCLPNSFGSLHATELSGPFILQVDEISDIGAPLRERYQQRGPMPTRCLKLSMTDGVQRVIGIEYQPIAALHNLFPAGLKICVRHVFVRRGVFLLSCDSVEVVGGLVPRLEEARQRAVHEINKPARGSRHRRGQPGDRSLAERATAAAWVRNTDETNPANPTAALNARGNSRGHSMEPMQPTAASIFQSFVAQDQPAHEPRATPVLDLDTNIGQSIHAARTETRSNFSVQQTTSAVGPLLTETRISAAVQQEPAAVDLTHTETRLNVSVQQATSSVHNLEVKRRQTTLPWLQTPANDTVVCEGSPPKISTSTFGSSCTQQRVVEQTTTHDSLAQAPGAGIQTPMNLDSDDDDFDFESVPATSQRHQTPSFSEEPFTYLAFLKERLSAGPGYNAAVGKIKCVLTGVKDFKFKDSEEFALIVHVDDGSLVTEALIHHEVVQKMVGFSPKEVNRALASSNPQDVREMKSNMKRFQAFLKKFEGLAYVQYKQILDLPVISHMEEGVKEGDLTALLARVGKDTSFRQHDSRIKSEFIDVSP